jgi:pimeloyl-ACP methyl ester carboxylesterase
MLKACVNGVNLHYQQHGQGSDVVLVHGLTGNLSFWLFTSVPQLAKHHRVTIYDLRGHGYSDMPPNGYSPRDLAVDLNGLLVELGIERAHLVGHSYGGTIALQHAVLYPEQTRSLVLCEPSLIAQQEETKSLEWILQGEIKDVVEAYGLTIPERLEWANLAQMWRELHKIPMQYGLRKGRPRRMARLERLATTTTVIEDFEDTSDLTEQHLATARAPTLMVYGELSPFLDTRMFLETHLPDIRSVVLPGSGHFNMTAAPEVFAPPVLEHFSMADGRIKESNVAR